MRFVVPAHPWYVEVVICVVGDSWQMLCQLECSNENKNSKEIIQLKFKYTIICFNETLTLQILINNMSTVIEKAKPYLNYAFHLQ